MAIETEDFLETLRKRAKKSRIYRPYQLLGLEISQLLEDEAHKSLYIKLAKENPAHTLLTLVKEVIERKSVKNKGAYFMKLLTKAKDHVKRSHSRK